ncbi:unnamed protein product [Paramecium sonneborni]|uniref:AraC effector-binding domain-containing protein n=1 Tax=Paramecium sonneborni TaxID=65129 RepID=A0A8S1RGQ5_9CILI|nr:unnamed protein product [Paramecium sonneborni]
MNPIPQKELVHIPKFTVIGLRRRIHLAKEQDQQNNTFSQTYKEFFSKKLNEQIQNRAYPGRTYCLYYDFKDFEDRSQLNYYILVGEVVTEVGVVPEGMEVYDVEESDYAKFQGGPGPIPDIIKQTWSSLHKIKPEEWGGKRTYKTEFEVYREGQEDIQNMTFQLYIGLVIE